MAALKGVSSSVSNNGASSSGWSRKVGDPDLAFDPDDFTKGLRVLVVDDDPVCLRILSEQLQRRCQYCVTLCSSASIALDLLRKNKDDFDIVLSDVHMPCMDGFNLLEQIELEMNHPVVLMSHDGETSVVERGIRSGACDYLIKPIPDEVLQNIWQHVARKKWKESLCGILKENYQSKQEYVSFANAGTNKTLKGKKRRNHNKYDREKESNDPSLSKKCGLRWSVELHRQFVSAIRLLGIDKATPKTILEVMNTPGLTRRNVASHLQKYRLHLKQSNEPSQQRNFSCSLEPNLKRTFGKPIIVNSFAELIGQPTSSLVTTVGQPTLLTSTQNMMIVEEVAPTFPGWPSNNISSFGSSSNIRDLIAQCRFICASATGGFSAPDPN